jgi:hypothetical protein
MSSYVNRKGRINDRIRQADNYDPVWMTRMTPRRASSSSWRPFSTMQSECFVCDFSDSLGIIYIMENGE